MYKLYSFLTIVYSIIVVHPSAVISVSVRRLHLIESVKNFEAKEIIVRISRYAFHRFLIHFLDAEDAKIYVKIIKCQYDSSIAQ